MTQKTYTEKTDYFDDNAMLDQETWICPYCQGDGLHFEIVLSHVPNDSVFSEKQYIINQEPIKVMYNKVSLAVRNREFSIDMGVICEFCSKRHVRSIGFHKGNIFQFVSRDFEDD